MLCKFCPHLHPHRRVQSQRGTLALVREHGQLDAQGTALHAGAGIGQSVASGVQQGVVDLGRVPQQHYLGALSSPGDDALDLPGNVIKIRKGLLS